MKMLTLICYDRTESSEDVVVTSTKSSLSILNCSTMCQGVLDRFMLKLKQKIDPSVEECISG